MSAYSNLASHRGHFTPRTVPVRRIFLNLSPDPVASLDFAKLNNHIKWKFGNMFLQPELKSLKPHFLSTQKFQAWNRQHVC